MIKIVIADDEELYARELAVSLAQEPDIEIRGIAFSGSQAVSLALGGSVEVVLMDLGMPVMGGLEAIRRIKEQAAHIEIVVLTGLEDNDNLFAALEAGARSYLLKNMPTEELVRVIRDVMQGYFVLPPALANRVEAAFHRFDKWASDSLTLLERLTPHERQVLKNIAQGKTNPQIGKVMDIEVTTVKKHVGSLLKKLEANNRTQLREIARNHGLK